MGLGDADRGLFDAGGHQVLLPSAADRRREGRVLPGNRSGLAQPGGGRKGNPRNVFRIGRTCRERDSNAAVRVESLSRSSAGDAETTCTAASPAAAESVM